MPVSSIARRLPACIAVGLFTVTLDAAAVRAQTTYSLHVVASLGGYVTAPGIDCGDGGRTDCDETYSAPTTVTLQATPSPGYELTAWTAQCTDGNPTATVVVNGAARCTAAFTPSPGSSAPADPMLAQATLFVDRVGSTAGPRRGILFGSDVTMEFPSDPPCCGPGPVTLSLPEYGYSIRFITGTPGDYEEQYDDRLSITGCSDSVGRYRVYESSFDNSRLTSFAADFEAVCSAPASQPRIVGAVRFNSSRARILPFDGEYPLFKVTIDPSTNGIVTSTGIDCGPGHTDCAETYSSARSVTLVATPLPGYRFVAWAGDCGGASTTSIHVDRARRCSAAFNAVIPGFVPDDPRLRDSAFLVDIQRPNESRPTRHVWLDAGTGAFSFLTVYRMELYVGLPNGGRWTITLRSPNDTELLTGFVYENVASILNGPSSSPRLLVESPDGTCSPASGRFVIHDWDHGERPRVAADFTCVGQDGTTITGSFRGRGGRTILTPFAPNVFTPVAEPPMPDVNRDGSPDLVWRHRTSGQNAVWMMSGVDASLRTLLEPAGAAQVSDLSWEIRAVGDMNGDGNPDLIWQNRATGQLAVWFLMGATRIGTNYLYTADGINNIESDLNWKIVAAGDMDRDGYVDLLWRHRVSGAIRLWHMQAIVQWDSVPFGAVSDSAWEIAGLADMNRDGLLDLVWRHYGSGAIASWFMYDTLRQAAARLSPSELTDVNWRIVGVADLNADGNADLVWQHLPTGRIAVWFLDGMTLIAGRYLNPPTVSDPDWRIVGVR